MPDSLLTRPPLCPHDILSKSEDWDILMLGHYCHDCPLVPAAPAYRAARAFFGTHGYVVHRRGLQKIFAYPHLYPIEKQIDARERAGLRCAALCHAALCCAMLCCDVLRCATLWCCTVLCCA